VALIYIISHRKSFASGSAWLPLLYDTTIFILTFYYIIKAKASCVGVVRSPILEVLWVEGLMYYRYVVRLIIVDVRG
jgi:hypothetical protein